MRIIDDDVVIVLAGEAGQGLQSIESMITLLLKRSGYNVFSSSEFMSRVRGGSNSTVIRVSSGNCAGFRDRIDILIALHRGGIEHLKNRISEDTIIIGDKSKIDHSNILDVRFSEIASSIGSAIYANTVAAGFLCGILKVDLPECEMFVSDYFSKKNDETRIKNVEAIKSGYNAGINLGDVAVSIRKNENVKENILITGADAIALGALAGGCDYVCGYPMSPSTSVLEKMAAYSRQYDIIVEQVEDEVGVVNMALGAWYSGARAFVTTSGGGFALMCEGISLCGMIESPLVVHLAQRPGPATGLPTRTEQGDLSLVLYAGHGDFPRIILAPGSLEEGFFLTQNAFNLSAKYQVPVFILTDQYYVDTSYNTPAFSTDSLHVDKSIIETNSEYARFMYTDDGISPRGIPGFGKGCVCADSDEHDESGHITEDMDVRVRMVDKRRKKQDAIMPDIIPPKFFGSGEYSTLIVCWGSTCNTVVEAVESLGRKDIAVLHFSWIFPLAGNVREYLDKASKVIIIENNSSAQFAQLIQLSTGFVIEHKILKYNGLPFSVEEVVSRINTFI